MREFAFKTEVKILDGEYWWGGAVTHGDKMPYCNETDYELDMSINKTSNPFHGMFTSNKGRYFLLFGTECHLKVKDGVITVWHDCETELKEGFGDLKGAYLAAAQRMIVADERKVPRDALIEPQYCTWAEMGYEVDQEKIISYANSIVECGLPHKVLIIDDGWMTEYGEWTFNKEKFPDPKGMIKTLKELGFKVEMWIVPYVRKTAADYQMLVEQGGFVKDENGNVVEREWWNGIDAFLDLTSPAGFDWLAGRLQYLIDEYGVDGFKFDGGGGSSYRYEDVTYEKVTPNEHSLKYFDLAYLYDYSELREGIGRGCQHLIQRLNDKRRSWTHRYGIKSLVPCMVQAGMCGYPFSCADMIGGGQIEDYWKGRAADYDEELVSRFCEGAALFPSMQFSYSYWRHNDNLKRIFLKATDLHSSVRDYLHGLIDESEKTFAPIVRPIEYEFPHQGFAHVNDAFMLGTQYYVTPIVEKDITEKAIALPSGAKWQYGSTGAIYDGGQTVTVPTPVGELPYFKRIG